jgi:hypothetical protein
MLQGSGGFLCADSPEELSPRIAECLTHTPSSLSGSHSAAYFQLEGHCDHVSFVLHQLSLHPSFPSPWLDVLSSCTSMAPQASLKKIKINQSINQSIKQSSRPAPAQLELETAPKKKLRIFPPANGVPLARKYM